MIVQFVTQIVMVTAHHCTIRPPGPFLSGTRGNNTAQCKRWGGTLHRWHTLYTQWHIAGTHGAGLLCSSTASMAHCSDLCRDSSWLDVSLSMNLVTNWPNTLEPWYSWDTETEEHLRDMTDAEDRCCDDELLQNNYLRHLKNMWQLQLS